MKLELSVVKCLVITCIWYIIYQVAAVIFYVTIEFIFNLSFNANLYNLLGLLFAYLFILVYIKKWQKINLIPKNRLAVSSIMKLFIILLFISILIKIVKNPFLHIPTIVSFLKIDPGVNKLIFKMNSENYFSFKGFNLIIEILQVVFLSSIGSELVFRRYFFTGLINKYNLKVALLFSSLFYSLIHFSFDNLFVLISYFITGLLAAYIFYSTSNILFPILFHMLLNVIYIFRNIFIHDYHRLIAYHKFGVHYWIVVIISAILLIYLLFLLNRLRLKPFNL